MIRWQVRLSTRFWVFAANANIISIKVIHWIGHTKVGNLIFCLGSENKENLFPYILRKFCSFAYKYKLAVAAI